MHRMLLCCTFLLMGTVSAMGDESIDSSAKWQPTGWGGGGRYWSVVFHPAQDGLLYMGSDVNGAYKSEDHARTWRIVNDGLLDTGVYSLAVDPQRPQAVYAGTGSGLFKSTDGAEHWQYIPKTGPKELHITAERGISVRAIAVDPGDGNVVYAGSPAGMIYKSVDGALTWRRVYQPAPPSIEEIPADVLRGQFGGVNSQIFGGFWFSASFGAATDAPTCRGLGFTFQGNGVPPPTAFLTLRTSDKAVYRSRNLAELFRRTDRQEVWLSDDDFAVDPSEAKKQPESAESWPKKPQWQKIVRMDFCCVNMDQAKPSVALLGEFYCATDKDAKPNDRVILRDFTQNKGCHPYGNVAVGSPKPPVKAVHSVAVAAGRPSIVLAATDDGVVMSKDAGENWQLLQTPGRAMSVAVSGSNPDVMFASFAQDGIWKSTDMGRTWSACSEGLRKGFAVREVAVSPANPDDVYAIGYRNYDGRFYASHDGGKTWAEFNQVIPDRVVDPTRGTGDGWKSSTEGLSAPMNLTINPLNPNELFISANWRPCWSEDAGRTWIERDQGADITCFYGGIQFGNGRVYACTADEGTFVSEDNGEHWRQLWPLRYDEQLSGHYWQLAVTSINGQDRIITPMSPWIANLPNRVVISKDGGRTFDVTMSGLPDYRLTANTMWGISHPRGLAVDPTNPQIIYLGMDGDTTPGKMGGGIFKSEDGGMTWRQLPQQPGSRRGYYGLVIDPTDVRRIFWTSCGKNGGLWRSEDGGDSWQHIFKEGGDWIFNVHVTSDGTVYCPGKSNLWRSDDHGNTWRQVTHFTDATPHTIIGMESDPGNPKVLWISRITWGAADKREGLGVYKTSDGGTTWQEITGNLPNPKPYHLRFNPRTRELWAAGSGVYKLGQ